MKNFVKVTAAVLLLASFGLESCKKGENDPFLSLRSRKGRVAGDWKITAGSGTDVSGSTTTTWTYDGATYTQTSGSNSTSTSMTMEYSFDKAGTWTGTTVTTGTGFSQTVTSSGTWNFTGGVGDVKNKSQIVMMTLSETTVTVVGSSSTTSTDTYTGSDAPTSINDLDELKNKEMIWKYKGSHTSGSTTSSSEGTYTATAK